MQQATLAKTTTLQGVGIHSGTTGKVTLHPAEVGTGRRFRSGGATFPAVAENVVDTRRCTTLGVEGVRVSTVEHLLSALVGCGVENVLLEVQGAEIPILDGSALPFAEAILSVGVVAQDAPTSVLTLQEPLILGEGAIRVLPSNAYELEVTTTFDKWEEGVATVHYVWDGDPQKYLTEIAPARTFAFDFEVQALIEAGLARGGSLDNALVITPPNGFSTPLRVPLEWCRHKVLDLLGDLALVGGTPRFSVIALRPGHTSNVALAQRLRTLIEVSV